MARHRTASGTGRCVDHCDNVQAEWLSRIEPNYPGIFWAVSRQGKESGRTADWVVNRFRDIVLFGDPQALRAAELAIENSVRYKWWRGHRKFSCL